MRIWRADLAGAFLLIAFGVWAAFSLVSISVLAVSHVFTFLAFITFLGKKTPLRFTPSNLALLALALFAVLSVLVNYNESLEPMQKIFRAKYLVLGALLYVMSNREKSALAREVPWIIALFVTSSFVSEICGLGLLAKARFINHDLVFRPSGLTGLMSFAYTAQFAVLLAAFLAFNPSYKFFAGRGRPALRFFDSPTTRWTFFILSVVNIYLVQARGGIIGVVVGIPCLFFWKDKRIFFALTLGGFLLLSVSAWKSFHPDPSTHDRMYTPAAAETNVYRISQYKTALRAFSEKPLLGIGWRSLEEHTPELKKRYSIEYPEFVGHAHNNYLEILSTTGALGFIAFLAWLFFWAREAIFINQNSWRAYYLACFAAFLVSGLFQSTIIDSEFCFTLFALYGLTPVLAFRSSSESSPKRST